MIVTKYGITLSETCIPKLKYESETCVDTIDNCKNAEQCKFVLDKLESLSWRGEEHAFLIALTSNCEISGVSEISHGCINLTFLSPREIFLRALLLGAASIIIIHNHPSGCCKPSKTDISAFQKLKDACTIMELDLSDFIIVGKNSCFSFRKEFSYEFNKGNKEDST